MRLLVALLVLLASASAWALTADDCFPVGAGACTTGQFVGEVLDTGAQVINVQAYGAIANGGGNGSGADNCAAFTAAVAALPSIGGAVYFAPGRYTTSCPIPLKANTRYYGANVNGTIIQTVGTGLGSGIGYALFQTDAPRKCTGGTGACDATMGTSGRGAACVCYTNADCQSGTCAGGTVHRDVRIDHLKLIVSQNQSIGIDYGLIGEGSIEDVYIVGNGSPTNAIGVFFSDGGGNVEGYSNTLFASKVQQLPICVRIGDRANDTRIISDVISTTCTTGLQIDAPANTAHVYATLFQSPAAGGKSVLDNGNDDVFINNRFEASASTHVTFGATSTRAQFHYSNFSGTSTKWSITGGATGMIINGAPASASAPGTCGTTPWTTGTTYYNTTNDVLCVCNGTAFTQQNGGGTSGC